MKRIHQLEHDDPSVTAGSAYGMTDPEPDGCAEWPYCIANHVGKEMQLGDDIKRMYPEKDIQDMILRVYKTGKQEVWNRPKD